VKDIGGVEYSGWSFAVYETGAIIAGAAAGRLSTYFTIRANMIAAALVFAFGCVEIIVSPSMPWLLAGRLISGGGGGALVSLCFVAVQRYFHVDIWPQLMAVLSVVWGVSAFGGPLFGAVFGTYLGWRWAFATFGAMALLFAIAARYIMRNEGPAAAGEQAPGPFPAIALLFLSCGVTAIAAAGIETIVLRSAGLLAVGVLGIALFFVIDARSPRSRLFPSEAFSPRTTVGSGLLMIAALAVSTCSFGFYGPLLLAGLHNFSPLTTGLIIASESISWSVLSILVAGASKRYERFIVPGGALMVAGGVAGFAVSVPAGWIPGILFCALLQGGGFGILWPFASRMVVRGAGDSERSIAASAFSTLQRIGYAVGAALAGIVANANGFSAGFTPEAARGAASVLFWAFLPLSMVGVFAAIRLARGPELS
jgi:MFS family permease